LSLGKHVQYESRISYDLGVMIQAKGFEKKAKLQGQVTRTRSKLGVMTLVKVFIYALDGRL